MPPWLGYFIVLEQENTRVWWDWGMLRKLLSCGSGHAQKGTFVGHMTLCTWYLVPYGQEMLKIVHPLIPSHYILPTPKVCHVLMTQFYSYL